MNDIPKRTRTWGENLDDWERRRIVGREKEQNDFHHFLNGSGGFAHKPLLRVTGPAGIGKTFLLKLWRREAKERGIVWLDADASVRMKPVEWLTALAKELPSAKLPAEASDAAPEAGSGSRESSLLEACLHALNNGGGDASTRIVLCLDACDGAGRLEQWLGSAFFPRLGMHVKVVMAGRAFSHRQSLAEWGHLTATMPLGRLSEREVSRYAARCGLDAEMAQRLWLASKGHPLTMALAAEAIRERGDRWPYDAAAHAELFEQVVEDWLREIPDEEMRELLSYASVLRVFNRESLAAAYGKAVSSTAFERLIGSWYAERTATGWALQPQLKEALEWRFKRREPVRYGEVRKRAASYVLGRLYEARHAAGAMDASMTDLLYYAEHPILKAHFHMRADEGYRWVPLDASRVARAAAYLDRRRTEAGTQQIVCGHPENGEVFRYELSGEESLLRIRDIGLRELQDRRSIVKLLVGETEEVLGLAVIWPITPHTVAKLREDRYTASYLRAQRPETLKQLLQNKSAFIRTIDIANMADDGLRHQSFGLMLDCLYEFDIIAASPPPVKFYEDSHRSVGFEPVSGAVHDAYGAAKWAQVYELQLQGSGFLDYAVRMLQGVEQPQAAAERSVGAGGGIAKPEEPLTEREAEIAGLMAEGRTNAEIAAEVYLSIVTVKKHVGAIYRKYGVTNRAQLMAKLLKG